MQIRIINCLFKLWISHSRDHGANISNITSGSTFGSYLLVSVWLCPHERTGKSHAYYFILEVVSWIRGDEPRHLNWVTLGGIQSKFMHF